MKQEIKLFSCKIFYWLIKVNFAGGFQGLDGVMGYIDAMSGKTPRNGMKFSNVLVP